MSTNSLDIISQTETTIYQALKTSIYPGASDQSIAMVLSYCAASKIDPMLKPVHLVPMYVSTGRKDGKGQDIKEKRDIVMPGINLYRILASRSGCAGISEPEFGEDVTESLGGIDITYPKWAKVTVKRIIAGKIVEFTAKEYWKENYATAGSSKDSDGNYSKSTAPNAMWKKRPYGQIAKCAEAQALRKAYPEIGGVPTAEEMEGKHIDVEEYEEIKKHAPVTGKGVKGLSERLELTDDTTEDININKDTGEILDAAQEEANFEEADLETIKFLLESASTQKDLIHAMKNLRGLNASEKKEAIALYKKMDNQLKG